MTQPFSQTRLAAGRSLVTRWRILAQRRLDYLVGLDESGRWKLYYSEGNFLEIVQEARANLTTWHKLAPPDAVLDKPVEVAIAQEEQADLGAAKLGTVSLGTAKSLPQPDLLDSVWPQHNLRKF
jgi:uncharacterized repeat protein (TIGR03809 family)